MGVRVLDADADVRRRGGHPEASCGPHALANHRGDGYQFIARERPLHFAYPFPSPQGTRITTSNVTIGEDDEHWFVTKNGSRVPAAAFIEGYRFVSNPID